MMEQHPHIAPAATPGRLRDALQARAEARIDLRNRRAERLARLRSASATPEAGAEAALTLPEPKDPGDEPELPSGDVEALERFLAGLLGTIEPEPEPLPQPARLSPPVVSLPRRPAADASVPLLGDAGGLAQLPGAGPGLIAALIRAGVPDLDSLARLDQTALRDRLGALALLIDVGSWIRFAQREVGRSGGRG